MRIARRVGAGVGLGHAECDVQLAARDTRQVPRLHVRRAVLHDRVHAEDREVDCAAAVHRGSGGGDLLEDGRGFRYPLAAAAVLLGDGDAHPSAGGEGGVEVPRELVALVALTPVDVVELGAETADAVPDVVEVRVGPVLARRLPSAGSGHREAAALSVSASDAPG